MKFTTEKNNPESQSVISEREKKIKKIAIKVIGIALAATTIAGAAGCTSRAETHNIRGDEIDQTVQSVIISPEARLRSDPFVPDEYDSNNIIETTDDTMTVETYNPVLIRSDNANGDWYGINIDDMKKANPDFDEERLIDLARNSKSLSSASYVWVNHQRASATRGTDPAN